MWLDKIVGIGFSERMLIKASKDEFILFHICQILKLIERMDTWK